MSEGVEVLSKRGKASIQEEENQGSDEESHSKVDGNELSETEDALGLEQKPKTRLALIPNEFFGFYLAPMKKDLSNSGNFFFFVLGSKGAKLKNDKMSSSVRSLKKVTLFESWKFSGSSR